MDRSLALTATDFTRLDHDQQLTLLLTRLIEVKLMPPKTNVKTLRGIVRVFETNLNTNYIPDGLYSGPLHLVGVHEIAGDDVDDSINQEDPITGWRQHAPKTTFWEGPGNHMTLLSPPNVSRLADWLRPYLKEGTKTREQLMAGGL